MDGKAQRSNCNDLKEQKGGNHKVPTSKVGKRGLEMIPLCGKEDLANTIRPSLVETSVNLDMFS
jgi:hypothetical protein